MMVSYYEGGHINIKVKCASGGPVSRDNELKVNTKMIKEKLMSETGVR